MINHTRLKGHLFNLAIIGILAISSQVTKADDNLGALISEAGWDKLIGTWIDPETNGKNCETSFFWKYDATLLECTTKAPNKVTTSLFSKNLKTGKVMVTSADSLGGCSEGECRFTEGVVTFDISFVDENKNEGSMSIKYTLVNDDQMEVTFMMGQPMTMNLIRKQSSE